MTPLPIDPLSSERPEFFAHPLPDRATRQTATPGDWAKLVFRMPGGELKQIWLVVESADRNRPGAGYVGRLAPWGYGTEFEPLFPDPVRFTTDHVYRLMKNQS